MILRSVDVMREQRDELLRSLEERMEISAEIQAFGWSSGLNAYDEQPDGLETGEVIV